MVEEKIIDTQAEPMVLEDANKSLLQLTNATYKQLVISNIIYLVVIQCVLNLFILAFMGKLKIILWNTIISFVVTLIVAYLIALGYHCTRRLIKWKFQ